MVATSSAKSKTIASRKERSQEIRSHAPVRPGGQLQQQPRIFVAPAAGAHAASHLINEDATPGAGVLPSHGHFGKEVDGAAG